MILTGELTLPGNTIGSYVGTQREPASALTRHEHDPRDASPCQRRNDAPPRPVVAAPGLACALPLALCGIRIVERRPAAASDRSATLGSPMLFHEACSDVPPVPPPQSSTAPPRVPRRR